MCDDCKRNLDAQLYAVDAAIADFVREEITLEYRIFWKRKRHERSSHLVRYRQIDLVNQITAEIRQIAA